MTKITKESMGEFVRARNFSKLFIELGWDEPPLPNEPLSLSLDKRDSSTTVKRMAQKRGFVVCMCNTGSYYPKKKAERRRLVKQLAQHHYEHLLILCGDGKQCWTIDIRPQNRPMRTIEVEWHENQDIQLLMQRLDGMIFDISEESTLGITDVVDRVRNAFMENTEKITKRFYKQFQNKLSIFAKFIEGIEQQVSKEWYAALMLNRLMFIYFIQKKKFLDGDVNYLENRLKKTKELFGDDEFHGRFYRHFLRRLFVEGLGASEAQRDPELRELLGRVPYLNGGLFDLHAIEEQNQDIQIPDNAFEDLFAFFNEYEWYLDSHPSASGKDINPDVIGYIFEKYINNRADMGAYYTQEDITGYIVRNTIIPFLLNRTREKCKNAFGAKNGIWRFLRDNPDFYIYDAVKKGCDIPDTEIPENIRIGLNARKSNLIERRKHWNTATEERFSLPTEIWRETIERRTQYCALKKKIQNGEVCEVDDLITHNLDIERFVIDALRLYEGSDFVDAFYTAIAGRPAMNSGQRPTRGISVLDPACGSGAFLFSALNVLEPLYKECVNRMHDFVDEDDQLRRDGKRKGTKKHPQFRIVLDDIKSHQNEKYWIYKTIILNNLYGVDLMKEASEIAKLRLFLKLAAEAEYDCEKINLGLEPLPDIDFNIRSGNSLVGFASMMQFEEAIQNRLDFSDGLIDEIKDEANIVQRANDAFRDAQDVGDESYRKAKIELGESLAHLNEKMNQYLADQYGKGIKQNKLKYQDWLKSHRPFHWLAEFYGIVEEGDGFDVVIGNPPYIEYRNVKKSYTVKDYATESCGNLYAFFMERARQITGLKSLLSMIVPLSGHSTKRMTPLVNNFYKKFKLCRLFNISSDNNPSTLFPSVKFRLAIFIVSNSGDGIFTTNYTRWYAKERKNLFNILHYTNASDAVYETAISKIADHLHLKVLQKIAKVKTTLRKQISSQRLSDNTLFFHAAPVNWVRSHTTVPYFHGQRDGEKSVELKPIFLHPESSTKNIHAVLCSTLFFIWWIAHSDAYHLNKSEISNFPTYPINNLDNISLELEKDMQANSRRRVYHYKTTGRVEYDEFYMKKSKHTIDKIDTILAKGYGFTEEELDYIINYDIKYRMGLNE